MLLSGRTLLSKAIWFASRYLKGLSLVKQNFSLMGLSVTHTLQFPGVRLNHSWRYQGSALLPLGHEILDVLKPQHLVAP